MTDKIILLIASHKQAEVPTDSLYFPVQVGAEGNVPISKFSPDNVGQNISKKNPFYNELTGLYWGWKNLSFSALGLVHYRRWLVVNNQPLTQEQAQKILKDTPIILPKKRHYVIETNYSHYVHAHQKLGIETLSNIIQNEYPNYLKSYQKVMNKRSAHMFNIFLMDKEYLDEYLTWLFEVLGKVEQKIQKEVDSWTTYEQRVYGFLSELMLDVWLETNNYPFQELPFKHIEGENWFKKIPNFLLRKFFSNSN